MWQCDNNLIWFFKVSQVDQTHFFTGSLTLVNLELRASPFLVEEKMSHFLLILVFQRCLRQCCSIYWQSLSILHTCHPQNLWETKIQKKENCHLKNKLFLAFTGIRYIPSCSWMLKMIWIARSSAVKLHRLIAIEWRCVAHLTASATPGLRALKWRRV